MKATIELTKKQMEQVLNAVRDKRPDEDGAFNFDIETDCFYICVEGDLHITYNTYFANDWYEEGYNDYSEEVGRELLSIEIAVEPKFDIYDNEMDEVKLHLADEQEERIANEIKEVA